MQQITIGIAGASGSGKSTLAEALLHSLNSHQAGTAVAIPIDAYYRDLSHMGFAVRDQQNFDHPDALELDLLARHLQELKQGRAVCAPVYDFTTHTRTTDTQPIAPAAVTIVEGILALSDASLMPLYDVTVFVEAPLDICLLRRIERDRQVRGRDEASVRRFWDERVLPMYQEFGEPLKDIADLTVNGLSPVTEGVLAIRSWIEQRQSL